MKQYGICPRYESKRKKGYICYDFVLVKLYKKSNSFVTIKLSKIYGSGGVSLIGLEHKGNFWVMEILYFDSSVISECACHSRPTN